MSTPDRPGQAAGGPDLERLQEVLGHRFRDASLLELALTHESWANEVHLDSGNNERLEFLGDSVLGLVVCRYLYERHPGLPEGRMAQIKAHLVSTAYLARKARGLDLGSYLRLGRGEALSEGRTRKNVLADTVEALIGALYLDGGLEAARTFVLSLLQDAMDRMEGSQKDYKSLLQELTQRLHKSLPHYEVAGEEGPPHERTFLVRVDFLGEILGSGTGNSKREASQKAARQALEALRLRAGFDLPGPGVEALEPPAAPRPLAPPAWPFARCWDGLSQRRRSLRRPARPGRRRPRSRRRRRAGEGRP